MGTSILGSVRAPGHNANVRSLPSYPYLPEKFDKARQLRYLGLSMKRIAAECQVSLSTVSLWTRDIEMLPRHHAANRERAAKVRADRWRDRHREQRRAFQREGRKRAREGDQLHAAGCMLYWAEGAKARNSLVMSNSDPAMLVMFVRFLRECFEITAEDISFSLNVYTTNGRTIGEIEHYWMDLLELVPACARKHMLNHTPTSSSGKRKNKLPYGVCTLRVKRSTWLVQHIYGAIQEYSGIDQPAWLDGPERKKRAA